MDHYDGLLNVDLLDGYMSQQAVAWLISPVLAPLTPKKIAPDSRLHNQ
jgi:hypothetical protein